MRPSVTAFLEKLREGETFSLSDIGPRYLPKMAIPSGLSLEEALAVVDAALSTPSLRMASIRGTCLAHSSPSAQSALLRRVAERLPGSRILCLNVGEMGEASREAYTALVDALPRSFVGNLYWHDPDPMSGTGLKEKAQAALRQNRKKAFYRASLLDDETWRFLKPGCKAWWKAKESARDVARAAFERGEGAERCRVNCQKTRCMGVNKRQERCCLCTRHESGYCRHHRRSEAPSSR